MTFAVFNIRMLKKNISRILKGKLKNILKFAFFRRSDSTYMFALSRRRKKSEKLEGRTFLLHRSVKIRLCFEMRIILYMNLLNIKQLFREKFYWLTHRLQS